MVTIVVWSPKGGVGKSTATASLAVLAAEGGERTLVWDLDAQGATTYLLGVDGEGSPRPKTLAKGRADLTESAVATRYAGLDVVPAGAGLDRVDRLLGRYGRPPRFLRPALQSLRDRYRWVFCDCPSGLSGLVRAALDAADFVLMPVVPDPLCVRSFEAALLRAERRGRRNLRIVPFLSMQEAGGAGWRKVAAALRSREPLTCRTAIPRRAEVASAARRRLPVVRAKPASPLSDAYRGLWEEVRRLPEA